MTSFPWRPLLYGLLLAGLLIRAYAIFELKHGLTHDESVSYLCAAATQGRYEVELPTMVDRTLVAGDIQDFYAQPGALDLERVAYDLAHDDIHPPLYFWILHLFHTCAGFDHRLGPIINLMLTLGMLALLYRLARSSLGEVLPALACCCVWFLSPAVIAIDLEARHYQLLGLLALAMFLVGRPLWNGSTSTRRLALFTVVNACGLLTHYYFAFLLLPGLLLVARRYGAARELGRYLLSLLGSFALFLIAFPEFFAFLPDYLADRETVAGGPLNILERIKAFISVPLDAVSYGFSTKFIIALLGAAALGLGMWRSRTKPVREARSLDFADLHLHLGWYFLFSSLLYLAGISPTQAIGGPYFCYLWPLATIALVHLAKRALSATQRAWAFLIFAVQLALACAWSILHSPFLTELVPRTSMERMSGSDMVITDEGRRGQLPRMVIGLPPSMPLIVGSKQGILSITPIGDTVSYWLIVGTEDGRMDRIAGRMRAAGYQRMIFPDADHELHYFTKTE